jgi:hypothetical protein
MKCGRFFSVIQHIKEKHPFAKRRICLGCLGQFLSQGILSICVNSHVSRCQEGLAQTGNAFLLLGVTTLGDKWMFNFRTAGK